MRYALTILLVFVTLPTLGRAIEPPPVPDWSVWKLEQIADREADRREIPRAVFRKLIFLESSWRPYVTSDNGDCHGLGQICDGTAELFEIEGDLDWPPRNLWWAAMILREKWDRHGDLAIALIAYSVSEKVARYHAALRQAIAESEEMEKWIASE